MFKNYLKVALRNLWKNKTFSALNIVGLAIGLGCFLLIALYVLDELSYDRYPNRAGDIYRINSDIRFGGEEMRYPLSSDVMGPALKKDYPQVEQYARIYANGTKLIKKGADFIEETKVAHVDSTFFELFTLAPLRGELRHALDQPGTVVLSQTAAEKYFGTVDAVNSATRMR